MYTWERDDRREVVLYSPHTIMGGRSSRNYLDKFLMEFQHHDPEIAFQLQGQKPDTDAGSGPQTVDADFPPLDGATVLVRGANVPLPVVPIRVALLRKGGASDDLDVSALPCGSDAHVLDPEATVFYNQPTGAAGTVHMSGRTQQADGTWTDSIFVDLPRVPASVGQVVFTASLDCSGATALAAVTDLRIAAVADREVLAVFPVTGLSTESAIVAVEVYRRANGWRLRGVGQGWADGLAGLARDYGIEVE
ncbi:TerD family protein [Frankia sp. CiP1_Cm_nod1]|uniref:TerD family protein n=1 Tax=Frankia sp. CiP1_Cm_nod1 TaxID=2897160 RepID=UPI00202421A9